MKNKLNKDTIQYYLSFIIGLLMLSVLCYLTVGCSTVKYVPIQGEKIVEYKDTIIYVKDTITIPVPVEVVREIVPKDTTSILRTSVALSEAKIEKGMLHHKLEQKGAIKTKIDTVVKVQYVNQYVDKEIPVEVQVEKKYIPKWCWISLIINIIIGVWFAAKIYFRFIK